MQENRKLRQVHRKMGEQVCTLMETSLLRKKSAWEEQIKKLRAQVEELQPRYPGMKGWRMHWDMQARASPPATPATPTTPASD